VCRSMRCCRRLTFSSAVWCSVLASRFKWSGCQLGVVNCDYKIVEFCGYFEGVWYGRHEAQWMCREGIMGIIVCTAHGSLKLLIIERVHESRDELDTRSGRRTARWALRICHRSKQDEHHAIGKNDIHES
jgi:hypothetical protein